MNDLTQSLDKALSDTFVFYVHAHICHWNVEGPRFSQLHELFGEIYQDAFEAIDGIAERIRTLDEPTPMSASALVFNSSIANGPMPFGADQMVEALREDNSMVSASLETAQEACEALERVGIANYLQERIDRHAKWDWMLSATLKAQQNKTTVRRLMLYDRAG